MASSFRDLRVWQDAMKLATDIYRSTADFPKSELYGLSQQMRRAAVSCPVISPKARDGVPTKAL